MTVITCSVCFEWLHALWYTAIDLSCLVVFMKLLHWSTVQGLYIS